LNVTLALDLLEDLRRLDVPALVRMSSDDGLTTLLRSTLHNAPLQQLLHPFNVLGPTISKHLLEGLEQDVLARAIHDDFRERRSREGRRADDPSMQPWERLGPDFKESSRRQADHIPIKLRAIDCAIKDASAGQAGILQPFQGFNEQEVDILARMEHASWNAERFLAGWDEGPRSERDRTSPYLVRWEQLPADVQNWDREAVQNIPKLLEKIGKSISR
jgi:hypothetical protein